MARILASMLAALVLAVAAAPASAVYIVTPLTLEPSDRELEVGDVLDVSVAPQNDTAAAQFGGKTVSVLYGFYPNESDPEGGMEESSRVERVAIASLPLDAQARATFQWTVPAEVDDHNVDLILVAQDGERVAFDYIAVGDAPPAMHILAGSGPGPAGPGDDGQGEADPTDDASDEDADAPGIGLVALLAALGVAVVVMRRR